MSSVRIARMGGFLCLLFSGIVGGESAGQSTADFREVFGPHTQPSIDSGRPRHPELPQARDVLAHVLYWNQVAIDASGLDHTPPAEGEDRVFGEQLGPGRASRAMAIVHIAIFDSVNAIAGGYRSYTGLARVEPSTSAVAAVAQAAHDTLVELFPSQASKFDGLLATDLNRIPRNLPNDRGFALGRRAAAAILALRAGDGSEAPEPKMNLEFVCSNDPGKWRQDPISHAGLALGANWGSVTPFVLDSPEQFRAPPPPAMDSAEYAAAFDEVRRVGGDGLVTPTERTAEQTEIGIFWAYDGTPSLRAPPRLYNQVLTKIAIERRVNAVELARLLALANVAMADAGIAIWESKYHYEFWRPPAILSGPISHRRSPRTLRGMPGLEARCFRPSAHFLERTTSPSRSFQMSSTA